MQRRVPGGLGCAEEWQELAHTDLCRWDRQSRRQGRVKGRELRCGPGSLGSRGHWRTQWRVTQMMLRHLGNGGAGSGCSVVLRRQLRPTSQVQAGWSGWVGRDGHDGRGGQEWPDGFIYTALVSIDLEGPWILSLCSRQKHYLLPGRGE